MASAQTWRNNDRDWSPLYMLTVGIWTGFLGSLSKKLEHQALFLSCGLEFFPLCYLPPTVASLLVHPCLTPCWTGHCPCAESSAGPGQCRCMVPSPPGWPCLSSRKLHGRMIQVSAYLCYVTALGIAPQSMLRNSQCVSCWDVKGPSSAEKWHGRTPGGWLEQRRRALAHCKLVLVFDTSFVLALFASCVI